MVMRLIYGSPIGDEVNRLTAEDVPGYELDISDALNFIDRVRSKEYSAKEVARVLRERLNFENPNVQILVLQLSDMCIKNGGNLIQLELTRREFMDAVYGLMESKTGRSFELRQLVLRLVQEWAELFRNNPEMAYVDGLYLRMKRMGYSFPKPEVVSSGAMVDSASAPEWEDSPVCQRCRTQFTFTNRKHHCRHCGKCFCNDCSSNTTSIPKFAIYDSVRVCHGCYLRLKKIVPDADAFPREATPAASHRASSARPLAVPIASTPSVDDNDEDLKRAIELSIQEAQHKPNYADYSLNPKIIGNSVPSSQTSHPVQKTQPSQSLYPSLTASSQAPVNMYPEVKNEPYPLTTAPTSNSQAFAEDEVDDPDLRAAIEASLQDVPGGSVAGGDLRVPDYLPATSSTMQVGPPPANEGDTDDNAPLSAFMPAAKIADEDDTGPLSNTERENVQLFESLLMRIRDNGQDIKNDPQVQYLHESIEQLHPKITDAIDVVDQKQKEFSKLHHRIITATKIYEQLLDKRLRSSTYTTASNVPVSNPVAYQNTQQSSIYPTLSSAQQPAYVPPTQQPQYNPTYPAQHGQQDLQRLQQPIQYGQFPEQQHDHANGNAPQDQYPPYNEPQQLSRSGSIYQQPQSQQQLSPNNPFMASALAYSAPLAVHSAAPVQPYNQGSGSAVSGMHQPQMQPQSSLVAPPSSANTYYSGPAAGNIPSIPPLQPTSVRHVDSTQIASTSNANASASGNVNANTAESEPEEALLIEF
ncbi:Vacuolar protein-sorting-associated protein 27 [Coemansia sp. RSA 1813]|nr:Vacuolar protein-sorting-associated protein 27 [Coemansia sp. RSA 1646]KAJ1767785.1 Vacuolar protein-sorting-associated protein 27 [Coemansia sp. RSA 1843]KAJ2087165.1 Vacuolar protein-sorting-associated protein 27 [Coemansia sp. RSA 986]KAJ2211994.1 Vacuolar protein-sorting-associated protein 27 [Coemansia sp. RSA 487]KAJ2565960.1 Vacuolar protein-sorting-associated protein 27 [Coemansia sp. RSA 1813]